MPGSEDLLDYSKVDSSAVEGVDEETFSYRWNIHKHILSNFRKKGKNSMKSPEFKGGKNTQHTWHLRLENKVDQYNSSWGVVTHLVLIKFGEKSVGKKSILVSAQFSILDENDKPISTSGSKNSVVEYDVDDFDSLNNIWQSGLTPSNPNEGLIRNDHFNIHCRVWVHTEKKIVNSHKVKLKLKNKHSIKTLQQDFKALLESPVYSDFVITTPTNEFKVHKNILSARSSVFAAMFESDMIEATSGKIAISDFSDKIITEMLNFIYSGEVENMKDNEMDLLKIADKYDIEDLKLECTQMILSSLTCENAVDILLAMDRCNIVQLKTDIINFIAKNARAVKATNGFKSLIAVDPELFTELISSMLEQLA